MNSEIEPLELAGAVTSNWTTAPTYLFELLSVEVPSKYVALLMSVVV